ncbi:hypothetical protein EVG20_g6868 [Dentipellis fragilis]|uniref:F-box domain-containing protein n=1 Tax=Dentipellis fragilis TaxID=205917 RepID=A0A4Y9YJH2_9AGAM|nr:hypothetical protein EVG20_g6868 [Dentipellis fragilis]
MRPAVSDTQDFGQFLAALSRMPALVVLDLCNVVSYLLSSPLPTSCADPVTFPKLQRLVLQDEVTACLVALKHLAIDSTMDVDIQCRLDPASEHGYDHILPWLISHIGGRQITPELTILDRPNGLDIVIPQGFIANAAQIVGGLPYREAGHSFRLCFYPLALKNVFTELRTICRILPGLERLEVLSISEGCASRNPQDWFSIFGRCHQLRRLELQLPFEDNDNSFWTALRTTSDANVNGHSGPLFPSLKSLTLKGQNVKINYNYVGMKLVMWTRLRMKLAPLQTIEFVGCNVDGETINRLGDEVPRVILSRKGVEGDS